MVAPRPSSAASSASTPTTTNAPQAPSPSPSPSPPSWPSPARDHPSSHQRPFPHHAPSFTISADGPIASLLSAQQNGLIDPDITPSMRRENARIAHLANMTNLDYHPGKAREQKQEAEEGGKRYGGGRGATASGDDMGSHSGDDEVVLRPDTNDMSVGTRHHARGGGDSDGWTDETTHTSPPSRLGVWLEQLSPTVDADAAAEIRPSLDHVRDKGLVRGRSGEDSISISISLPPSLPHSHDQINLAGVADGTPSATGTTPVMAVVVAPGGVGKGMCPSPRGHGSHSLLPPQADDPGHPDGTYPSPAYLYLPYVTFHS